MRNNIMKTADELRCIYHSKDYTYPSHSCSNYVVFADGSWYPFIEGKLSNPLDPITLLVGMLHLVGPSGSVSALAAPIDKLLRTCAVATSIRNRKPTFITKCNSGAPKTLLVDGEVIILGDRAKKDGLMLSILSSQIAGDSYNQSAVRAWKELGFSRPRVVDVDSSIGRIEGSLREVTEYTIKGWYPVNKVTIAYTGNGVQVFYDYVEGEKTNNTRKFMSTPKYAWQDKGEAYED